MAAPADWPTRDLVAHRAATTPDRTALVDARSGERMSYADFDRRVAAVAARLAAVTPQSGTVGTVVGARVAAAEVLFAGMRLGATVVPCNVRETSDEIAAKLDRVSPDALVCERDTESLAVGVADCPVFSVDDPGRDDIDPLGRDESVAEASASFEPATLARDDEVLIAFTSGTTGRAKGVRLTHGNLLASATASAFRLGVDPADRWLCSLPPCHVGGLAPFVRSAIYGTTAVVQREFDPSRTASAIADRGITGISLVPTMLRRLLDDGWTPPDHLRFVLLGGAPASETLIQRCRDRDVPVWPTYGTTETASQIATATPSQAFEHPGTVGQPLVTTDLTIVDDDGEPVEPGTAGEIVVAGPTVSPGYLDADATAAAFGDRGFHTGDLGRRDEAGRLWVTGRLDDRIVTGGETVDPQEVRSVLLAHAGVSDATVVGIVDDEWGQRVAALVVPAGEDMDRDALESHCRDRLAGFKVPKTIVTAASLPRTASGTVDREAIRNRLR